MRELKIRAWVIKDKEMLDVKRIDFSNKTVHVPSSLYLYEEKFENVELMQYTGLHDKNGVEIYEGDIVKKDNTYCEVFWNKKIAGFGMKYKTEIREDFYDCMLNDVEVIGNIHQNPELLGGNQ